LINPKHDAQRLGGKSWGAPSPGERAGNSRQNGRVMICEGKSRGVKREPHLEKKKTKGQSCRNRGGLTGASGENPRCRMWSLYKNRLIAVMGMGGESKAKPCRSCEFVVPMSRRGPARSADTRGRTRPVCEKGLCRAVFVFCSEEKARKFRADASHGVGRKRGGDHRGDLKRTGGYQEKDGQGGKSTQTGTGRLAEKKKVKDVPTSKKKKGTKAGELAKHIGDDGVGGGGGGETPGRA